MGTATYPRPTLYITTEILNHFLLPKTLKNLKHNAWSNRLARVLLTEETTFQG